MARWTAGGVAIAVLSGGAAIGGDQAGSWTGVTEPVPLTSSISSSSEPARRYADQTSDPTSRKENSDYGPAIANPEPQEPPMGDSAGSAPPLSEEEISEIQRLLNALEFDVGSVDGIPGPQTRAGITAFQDAAGLPVDGTPSRAVLDALRQRAPTDVTSATARHEETRSRPPVTIEALPGSDLNSDNPTLFRTLDAVIERAEKASAAPEVIESLRRARSRLGLEGLVRVIDSDFFRTKSVPAPWETAGDGFRPHWRFGMYNGREDPGALRRAANEAWFAFSSLLGIDTAQRHRAELYSDKPFETPFRLSVGFRWMGEPGKLEIGPYSDGTRKDGHRFVFAATDDQQVSLVHAGKGGVASIDTKTMASGLARNVLHELTWLQTPNGWMEVRLDGVKLFSVRAPARSGAFRGVTVTATDARFSIAHVQLEARSAARNLDIASRSGPAR